MNPDQAAHTTIQLFDTRDIQTISATNLKLSGRMNLLSECTQTIPVQ